MEDLPCPYLINCLGNEIPTKKALQNKDVVAFYFSASFCVECDSSLTKLRLLQEAIKRHRRCGIIIIYISFDTDEAEMLKHFKTHHHGWFVVPLKEPTIKLLQLKYTISFIPQIVVVKVDGTIVTRDGMKDLEEHGNNVIIRWSEPDITCLRYTPINWLIVEDTPNVIEEDDTSSTLNDIQEFGESNEFVTYGETDTDIKNTTADEKTVTMDSINA
nr:nucleoredoxin-like protein 1 [Onthophagus taurus]